MKFEKERILLNDMAVDYRDNNMQISCFDVTDIRVLVPGKTLITVLVKGEGTPRKVANATQPQFPISSRQLVSRLAGTH
jgi:hypothetical protein